MRIRNVYNFKRRARVAREGSRKRRRRNKGAKAETMQNAARD
jgi:hypothetical protein